MPAPAPWESELQADQSPHVMPGPVRPRTPASAPSHSPAAGHHTHGPVVDFRLRQHTLQATRRHTVHARRSRSDGESSCIGRRGRCRRPVAGDHRVVRWSCHLILLGPKRSVRTRSVLCPASTSDWRRLDERGGSATRSTPARGPRCQPALTRLDPVDTSTLCVHCGGASRCRGTRCRGPCHRRARRTHLARKDRVGPVPIHEPERTRLATARGPDHRHQRHDRNRRPPGAPGRTGRLPGEVPADRATDLERIAHAAVTDQIGRTSPSGTSAR